MKAIDINKLKEEANRCFLCKVPKCKKQKLTKCTKYVNFKPIIKRQTQKGKLVPCAADITVKSEDDTNR